MSCPVPEVLHQQSLLAAVLDRALQEVQLVREVQDGSGTNGPNWHNELFPFSDADELVEIILVLPRGEEDADSHGEAWWHLAVRTVGHFQLEIR